MIPVDQTTLLLEGDTHGRRDHLHVYDGPNLAKTIKQQFKVHWPAPGTPSFKLPVYDLYRDPRESYGSYANYGFTPYSAHHSEQRNPDGGIERLRMASKTRQKTTELSS